MSGLGDPVLKAWADARDARERTCIDAADVTLAALSGVAGLAAADARHLLDERCERCETLLLRTWARSAPPAKVLARAPGWPADGALRVALAAHVTACEHDACHRAADAITATDTAPSPATPSREPRPRLADLVDAGRRLAALLLPTTGEAAAIRGTADREEEGEPTPATVPGVSVEVSTDTGAAYLVVDFTLLATTEPEIVMELGARPVTIYLVSGHDHELVGHASYDTPEGVQRRELQDAQLDVAGSELSVAFVVDDAPR